MTALAEQVAGSAYLGRPSARKTGRDPRWPYVPVVIIHDDVREIQQQIKGLAYATRDEALATAERSIQQHRERLARQLDDPRYRALRRQYGLPEETS